MSDATCQMSAISALLSIPDNEHASAVWTARSLKVITDAIAAKDKEDKYNVKQIADMSVAGLLMLFALNDIDLATVLPPRKAKAVTSLSQFALDHTSLPKQTA